MLETRNPENVDLIAGPCSVGEESLKELYQLAEITVSNGDGSMVRALSAARVVGLKSRTGYDSTGNGMGMDFAAIEQAIIHGHADEVPPSILMAKEFSTQTGMGIAAEIMEPAIQMPMYRGHIRKGQFMPWQPSTLALGWQLRNMGNVAAQENWTVGIKNPKWLGSETLQEVLEQSCTTVTSMEQTWVGLASYAKAAGADIAFIHRGVDVAGKADFRNAPVHSIVYHVASKVPDARRYFDPSHSYGPKKRDDIVQATIEAMKMEYAGGYLYHGILVEAGTSVTDTAQHITIEELGFMAREIAKFRKFNGPFSPTE